MKTKKVLATPKKYVEIQKLKNWVKRQTAGGRIHTSFVDAQKLLEFLRK